MITSIFDFPQGLDEFGRGPSIGDQSVNFGKRTDARDASAPKLAEVSDHIDFFRIAHHQAVQLGLKHVGSRRSDLEIEPINGEKKAVGMKVLEHRLGLRSYERARHRPQQSAHHDHRDVRGIHQFVGDVQGVRDDSDRLQTPDFQVAGDFGGGRAGIEDDGFVVLNEFGCGSADSSFFRVMQRFLQRSG